jgi:hypothetical protein
MNQDIFGYSWEDIQSMQRKEFVRPLSNCKDEKYKADVTKDIDRRFPVADCVVKKFAIAMPDGYELREDVWHFVA